MTEQTIRLKVEVILELDQQEILELQGYYGSIEGIKKGLSNDFGDFYHEEIRKHIRETIGLED